MELMTPLTVEVAVTSHDKSLIWLFGLWQLTVFKLKLPHPACQTHTKFVSEEGDFQCITKTLLFFIIWEDDSCFFIFYSLKCPISPSYGIMHQPLQVTGRSETKWSHVLGTTHGATPSSPAQHELSPGGRVSPAIFPETEISWKESK